ncbi:DNA cytosine methyltransferase [Euryarchaeota archaeon]|nr:DNA cytosine methyltransferase [Euryarchaeota archaeon]
MRFVDLFCGIGGFHAALHQLGHECVFATDIDEHAAKVYESNWGQPQGSNVNCDIRDVIDEIPKMDIICAGFPCQPFSKSGSQQGFSDLTRGTLFHDICALAAKHKPAVLFLENVPNLVKHDNGNTFSVIQDSLTELGYEHYYSILSPNKFGIPQIRKRVYIVAIRSEIAEGRKFNFPEENLENNLDVRTVLDDKVPDKYNLSEKEIHWIETWEDFLKNVNLDTKLPGHPIWADSFKGDAIIPGDLEDYSKEDLIKIHTSWSSYGWVKPIELDMDKFEIIKQINLPLWKQDFVRKNRLLYNNNKQFIDDWLGRWKVLELDQEGKPNYPVSRTKYEWQAGPNSRSNWENIFQLRPSGIRVKKGDYFPALVAMAQIPVIGWLKRRLTPIECARIQSFDVDGKYGKPFILGENDSQSYKQLGNAVNVKMISLIQKRIDLLISETSEVE